MRCVGKQCGVGFRGHARQCASVVGAGDGTRRASWMRARSTASDRGTGATRTIARGRALRRALARAGGGGRDTTAAGRRDGRDGVAGDGTRGAGTARARADFESAAETAAARARRARVGRGGGMRFFAGRVDARRGGGLEGATIGEVRCTAKEREVFDTLLAVVEHFKLDVTLRVAGGWVRDKLVGRESDDIDVALDTMLGKEFAEKVNAYLEAQGMETKGIGVIQSNPEQSKHLETATMRVRDVWLDLVNLRSENYSEDSRIPEMQFGTAKDDAFRRDLTINALFYNINEKKVEDFTERGIEDLSRGVVRTPLPPRTTFLDDPLRILRAVRFAARFGFDVDEEIGASASDPDVQHALKHKVSRERFGKEVLGMLKGRSPADAVALMAAFKISPIVLQVPTQSVVDAVTDAADRLSQYSTRCVEGALEEIASTDAWMDEEKRVWLYLASWLLPYRELQSDGKKGKKVPAVGDIISNALKLRSKDAETTVHVHESMALAKTLLTNKDFTRLEGGLALRKMGETWRLAVLLEALCAVVPGMSDAEVPTWAGEYAFEPDAAPADVRERVAAGVKAAVSKFEAVEQRVASLELNECWETKPPVTGQDVMAALNMTKGGPELKKWIDKSVEWALENPNITKEECVEKIKQGGH